MTSEFLIFSGLKSSYEAACEEGQKKLLFFIQFQTFVFTSTSSHFSLFSLLSLSLPFFISPQNGHTFAFLLLPLILLFTITFYIISSPNQDLVYFLTCSPSAPWFLSSPPFPSPSSLSSKLSRWEIWGNNDKVNFERHHHVCLGRLSDSL